jgi:acylaminoacyl-peptidase
MKKLEDYKIAPIFPMQPLSDPQISPDGDRVLFTYTTANMKENRYDSHIWLLHLKNRTLRQFTHGKGNDNNPRWSPDGRNILFLSNRKSEQEKAEDEKAKMQVWVIPADGGEARRITFVEEGAQRPTWSPDGKTILFFCNVFEGERAKDSDTKIIRRIKYRFDGRGYFWGMRTHLFSVPSKGGGVRQLTDGEFDVETATWSPDGKQIALVSNLEEDADLSFFNNIYTIPAKGGKPKILWNGEKEGIDIRTTTLEWSPDGKHLAFAGRVIEDTNFVSYKNAHVWILPVKGGKAKNLTVDFDRTVSFLGQLKWSPTSRHVYFTVPEHGSIQLCRVSLDGKVERVIKGRISVLGFSLDRSGSIIAFNTTDATTPSELWIKDESGVRRVTNMNRGLLMKLRPIKPDEFWFKASDGVRVQGWIIKPRNFDEGKKYPMILEIHGGPHADYGYMLTTSDFQVLADHGFVVVYTNPRGSTGYGESFAAEISGNWGERDYQDLMEAVDYVIKTYLFIDPDRLGVMGVSYGGYMTNWVVGHTDRFKAAVSLNSICNLYSDWGTGDISWRDHSETRGKDPWDDPNWFMEKSPISYIKNIKTPLLLIHSEEDYRCAIEQSEQLFLGLKKLKRIAEFVRFPGESHQFGSFGKPKHRVERLQHILRWFDTYLKGT